MALYSQGYFFIETYDTKTIRGFRQNWDIIQDSSGYIFFGNQVNGLIQYNGVGWTPRHLPNGNTVRSLENHNGNIFWGGVGDFGYIDSDSLNNFYPRSLRNELDSLSGNFTDIWQTGVSSRNLFLRSYEAVFKLEKDSIKVINPEMGIQGLFELGNEIAVQIDSLGLFKIVDNKLHALANSGDYVSDRLYVILPFENEYLFLSRQQGFMLYDGYKFRSFETEAADYVKQHKVYRAVYLNEQEIAIATLSGGIVIINTRGELKTIITEEDGLPTNIIYDLYVDREQILWAATDNGLSKMLVNNPVTKLNSQQGYEGIPGFLETLGEKTYIGSTEGIFYISGKENLQVVNNSIARVYDGAKNGDEIWAATSEGVIRITERGTQNISDEVFSSIAAGHNSSRVFYGVQEGSIFRLELNGESLQRKQLVGQEYYFDDLYVKDDEVWAISSAEGVFRIGITDTGQKKYLVPLQEGDQYEKVGIIEEKIHIGTGSGLYTYDTQLDSLVIDSTFNDPELTSMQVNRFKQCQSGEVWFRNNRKIKRAVLKDGSWEVTEDPYRLIDEGESITTITCGEGNSMWFGGSAGIYHLSNPDWEYNHTFNTNITGLLVHNDSLIYGGYGEPETDFELLFKDNELRFTYAAASYIAPEENRYRVRLKGYDNNWSSWTAETEKDYTFIPEGTYTFEVQGRNVYHKLGTIDSFTFTVLPPWYRTVWAYIAYVLLAGSIIYALYRFRINNILREQRVRNRIASDLHDEVSATLSSISYFAEAIKKSPGNGQGRRFVNLISESANDAKEKITDIIWSIDPENDDWIDLLSKCRRFASDLLESKNIAYELNIDESINRPLDLQLRQHLWLIFKEMITNAARHSEADRVDIRLTYELGELTMVVQDNGKGFNKDADSEGNGIENIRNRAKKIKAEIILESDIKIGTRWILKKKL
ncbi:MAG: triple tyrosine motif-containing protein [Balneolaceae bacterium]|nr:triple tyrosine motif-containing protein [Balneolaceae bacterium]